MQKNLKRMYIYSFAVHLKLTQHYKSTILQFLKKSTYKQSGSFSCFNHQMAFAGYLSTHKISIDQSTLSYRLNLILMKG